MKNAFSRYAAYCLTAGGLGMGLAAPPAPLAAEVIISTPVAEKRRA